MYKIISHNEEDTVKIGEYIGKHLKQGDILCLNGDLGAGKTTLTKSIAKALGVEEYVTSPSFTIVNEYEGALCPIYHFDVYRINDLEEMYEIGYEEYFFGEGICIIEWAHMVDELLPDNVINIELHRTLEEHLREVFIKQTERGNDLIKGLKQLEITWN